jgi:hypothetical protein
MKSITLAISVVFPLLVYMLVGGWIRRSGILSKQQFQAINGMVFRIFIPLTLFFHIYHADLKDSIQGSIFGFVLAAILITFAVSWIVVSRTIHDEADAATMIQGLYRSNYVLFGNYVAVSLCGQNGVALVAALAAMVVPLFNILAVILFECKRGGSVRLSDVLLHIVKNPLVQAGVLGCFFQLFSIPIPSLLEEPLQTLGDIATPLALVTLGGLLSFDSILHHRAKLLAVNFGRLVIIPLIWLTAAILLGIHGETLIAVLAVFASPTAVASAPMAQEMGGNGALAGEIVATTTTFCIVSIFLFVAALSGMGFI